MELLAHCKHYLSFAFREFRFFYKLIDSRTSKSIIVAVEITRVMVTTNGRFLILESIRDNSPKYDCNIFHNHDQINSVNQTNNRSLTFRRDQSNTT